MAEHTDLRHIMGVGIAITRGSAAALSFCYSLLLLTMSRNLLTKLKEFSIQQYIPLDAHIQFHKIAACTALFFSVLHTVGHIVNFYHVSTQPIAHLRCLTSEISFPSDARPTISFWLFRTVTGSCSLSLSFSWIHPRNILRASTARSRALVRRSDRYTALRHHDDYLRLRASDDTTEGLQVLLVDAQPLRGPVRALSGPWSGPFNGLAALLDILRRPGDRLRAGQGNLPSLARRP